ncbi:hypothetical protein LB504_011969 [Fusarium proliferatum]|nr:hypothetical protein LB504_011969 [Fusarium proliferatum]
MFTAMAEWELKNNPRSKRTFFNLLLLFVGTYVQPSVRRTYLPTYLGTLDTKACPDIVPPDRRSSCTREADLVDGNGQLLPFTEFDAVLEARS